jgi:hypothetical protein
VYVIPGILSDDESKVARMRSERRGRRTTREEPKRRTGIFLGSLL